MPAPPITREQAQEALDAFNRSGRIKTYAAAALGMHRMTYTNRLDAAVMLGLCEPDAIVSPAMAAKAYSIRTDRTGAVTGETVTLGKPPGEVFAPLPGQVIKGESAYVDAEGRIIGRWIKTGQKDKNLTDFINAAKLAIESWTPPGIEWPASGDTAPDRLTIYPLADVHLGLRAFFEETGEEYNTEIAVDRFKLETQKLFAKSPNSENALILQLGDWTHVDDDMQVTPTSKNTLQVDRPILQLSEIGADILVDYIYMALSKHKNVMVKILKGNHDINAWIALYLAVKHHFRNEPRVVVDADEADYWFFRFGVNLIGAHHGHRLKPEQMAASMAVECREDWGSTDFRFFFHGHLHHVRAVEVFGVLVECLRSLSASDRFHSGKYNSNKSLVSITLDKYSGEEDRQFQVLKPIKRRAATMAE
jgi:predicted phosphodiesterase